MGKKTNLLFTVIALALLSGCASHSSKKSLAADDVVDKPSASKMMSRGLDTMRNQHKTPRDRSTRL